MHQPFYASSEINRQGDYRNNKKLIEKIIVDEKIKFIPYYEGKNLFKQKNENIEAIKLNNKQLITFFPNLANDQLNETNYYYCNTNNIDFMYKQKVNSWKSSDC